MKSWRELAQIFPKTIVPRLQVPGGDRDSLNAMPSLQAIYKSVDDVDLFVGGLLETREEVPKCSVEFAS